MLCPTLEAQIIGIGWLRHDLAEGAHIHRGPAAYGSRAQQEAGDDATLVLRFRAAGRKPPLQRSHHPLRQVELALYVGGVRLMVRLLASADLPHRDGAIDQPVSPRAV